MKSNKSILVVDDDAAIIVSLRLLMTSHGFEVLQASSPSEAVFIVESNKPSIVLLDMNYSSDTTSGEEGLNLIGKLREQYSDLPLVVMTGWATVDIAVSAMQKGANDFIQKPWDNQRLLNVINAQLEIADGRKQHSRLQRENEILKQQQESAQAPLIAESPAMQRLLEQVNLAAKSDANILMCGENGTGKSMLAEYIHSQSHRHANPFVAVNMGAMPDSLFESELFGHTKGAFTDAKSNRMGRVELADGGTLFLDEIGNLPINQQAKLLHLLENKTYQAIGSSLTHKANVRVISATNADLEKMVQAKSFRMDLLYRLNTIPLTIPPLRQRSEDIIPLAKSFLSIMATKYQRDGLTLSEHAQNALVSYEWPGNVRELNHVIERALVFAKGEVIDADSLMLRETSPVDNQEIQSDTLAEIEKAAILERLAQFDNNAIAAAKSLGLSRSAFYRRLDKYQLD